MRNSSSAKNHLKSLKNSLWHVWTLDYSAEYYRCCSSNERVLSQTWPSPTFSLQFRASAMYQGNHNLHVPLYYTSNVQVWNESVKRGGRRILLDSAGSQPCAWKIASISPSVSPNFAIRTPRRNSSQPGFLFWAQCKESRQSRSMK